MKKMFHKDQVETTTEEKQPRSIRWKRVGIIGGTVLGLLLIVFVGFGFFFQSHFFFRSTINGVDGSAATADVIQQRLEQAASGYELTIVDADGGKETLEAAELGMEVNISGENIQGLLEEQNGFLWVYHLFCPVEYQDDALVSCDRRVLKKHVERLECVKNTDVITTEDAKAVYKDGSFEIEEEVYGTEIVPDEFVDRVEEAVITLQPQLDLKEDQCYKQPKYTAKSKEVKNLVKTLNAYLDTKITYEVGSAKEVIPKDTIASWLSGDEKMQPVFDRDKMGEFVSSMRKKYDTYGQSKQLATQYGVTVTIAGGNYGWRIDKEGEIDQLIADLEAGKSVKRDFVYQYQAASREGNDYGNSYVEINRTAQHLFLVIDGAVVMDTAVVTGNPNNGHETPVGAYRITYCERNATLRGDDYATPVAYWMPFNGDIGLHDATWQKAFGGARYREGYGSHGCVNLPLSAAGTIFSYVSTGFPVLLYDMPGTETIDSLTQKSVDECKNAINAIGVVTADSGGAIANARGLYNGLKDSGKMAVDNYQALVDAETTYSNIWTGIAAAVDAQNQADANRVIALIDGIGTVTLERKSDVEAAKSAYDALSDGAKAKVTNKAVLDAAVAQLQELEATP